MDFFIGLGYIGLFLGSLLAGSIVPFSSELLLAGCLTAGLDPVICLIAVTLGNIGGGMTCYFIGRLGKWQWIHKVFKVKMETLEKYQQKIARKGAFMALLSWLPYVGETISITLGLMQVPIVPTLFYMSLGKLGRYLVMLLAILGIIQCF